MSVSRGCTDHVHAMRYRWLMEKNCEEDRKLFMVFMDIEKDYDGVSVVWDPITQT